jgi:ubiquinone/menaquinone biosynthesis C-methylase UbiE
MRPPTSPPFRQPTAAAQGYAYDNNDVAAVAHHAALADLLDDRTRTRIEGLLSLEGARCAEVAAGGGSVAHWLTTRVGSKGFVLATDVQPELIGPAAGLVVLPHDITTNRLPGDAYDLVHARLLLNHLPNREVAVANMIASLRPGGWLLVEDFSPHDHLNFVLCAPSPEDGVLLRRFHLAHLAVLRAHGNDTGWSRRAARMLADSRLQRITVAEFGGSWQAGSPGARLLATGLAELRPQLRLQGLSDQELDRVRWLLTDSSTVVNGHVLVSVAGQRAG